VSDSVVATVQKRGRFWAAEPYFPAPRGSASRVPGPNGRRLTLASNRVIGSRAGVAKVGDLVVVRAPGRAGRGRGGIVRVIGRPDVARDTIEALAIDRGLARSFAEEVELDAERARAQGTERAESEVAAGRRRDLRDLCTFTIDPASARDFDDAISAQQLPAGGVRVWVHIADVSLYVPAGAPVDREARRRGTSVYLPGTVEPMLPPALSNEACSLMAGLARAAVTVELDFDGARVARSAFYRSLIRSDVRLDYEHVQRIFDGRERAREPWASALEAAREVASALAHARAQAGGLALDSEEPEFTFDVQGNVSAIAVRDHSESHALIEQLMIAANEAVAQHLAQRKIPCLYRVHERPEPARVQRLVEQLASLGVPTPAVADAISPSQAAQLIGELSQRIDRHVRQAMGPASSVRSDRAMKRGPSVNEREHVGESTVTRERPWGGRIALTRLLLRSLQQAYYSPTNIGHAGLHSSCYCHFTSPIRRYPDLVCHRALCSTLGDEPAPRAEELRELGEWASEREREAMAIERAGDDVARCFALERVLYEDGWEQTFSGEVAGLISAGAFVAFGHPPLPAPLYEGMLPVRRLRADAAADTGRAGDWWELNEHETVLRGERSGAAVRLGDAIAVRVDRIDSARGRVDLVPA
jgi:ribonuclease R